MAVTSPGVHRLIGCVPWVRGLRTVSLTVSLLGVSTGCDRAKASPVVAVQATATTPAVMMVDTATVLVPHAYPGQLYVEQDVAVAARASGMVDSLLVNLGSAVRAEATLATIDRQAQEIELARAQLALGRARNAFTRSRELARSGGVTPADSEQVELELRQAELAFRQAQRDVALTRVTAPFDGVVTARYVRPHQLVAAGDTLFRIAASAPLLARVRVPEAAARSVRIGDAATVVAAGGATRSTARVRLASPSLDAASGTREVILQLAPGRFLAGESVTVELGGERRRVLVAPRAAIAADGFALVMNGSRTIVRPVTVGATLSGDRVEILGGLSAGERLAPPRR